MADCEKINACPFFTDKMPDDSGLGAMYKKKYCQGSNKECARYMALQALGPGNVPLSLYPNMVEEARKLIKENRGAA